MPDPSSISRDRRHWRRHRRLFDYYHLAKRGKKDVLLLGRSKLTSGTTWHSAAQVRQLRSSSA